MKIERGLKLCPFCENKQNSGMGVRTGTEMVYCQCGASKPIHGWNNRPIEDRLSREINRLNAVVTDLEKELLKPHTKIDLDIEYGNAPDY